jgi:hypothetical protein
LDAAVPTGQSLGFRVKTPKTKVGMYALPQGCSAKREIILIERAFVHNFYLHTIVKTLLAGGNAKMMKNLTILSVRTKAPPSNLKGEGRRRC